MIISPKTNKRSPLVLGEVEQWDRTPPSSRGKLPMRSALSFRGMHLQERALQPTFMVSATPMEVPAAERKVTVCLVALANPNCSQPVVQLEVGANRV